MRTLLLLVCCLWATGTFAQTIKIGDNLKQEFQKMDTAYFFEFPPLIGWAEESEIMLIGSEANAAECAFLFIALEDTTLIGVFNTTEPNVFMFDSKGDSILTTTSEFFMLPEWVVKRHTKVSDADKSIYQVLDNMYEQALQADSGDVTEETMLAYTQFATDTTLSNRHIALLFDTYQTILRGTSAKGIQPPAEICIPLINQLAEACQSLYGSVPAIVVIYQGEALESAGEMDKARTHFKKALEMYPNSVPLQVYNCELEQNEVKKKALSDQLRAQHPNHWMVKELP